MAATSAPLLATLLAPAAADGPHATRGALLSIAGFGLVTASVGLAALDLLDPAVERARLALVAALAPVAVSTSVVVGHVVGLAVDRSGEAAPAPTGLGAVLPGLVVLAVLLAPRRRADGTRGARPPHDPVAAGTTAGLVLGVTGGLLQQVAAPPWAGGAPSAVAGGIALLVGGAVLLRVRQAGLEPLVVGGLVAASACFAAAVALPDDGGACVLLVAASCGLAAAVRGLIGAVRLQVEASRTGRAHGTWSRPPG